MPEPPFQPSPWRGATTHRNADPFIPSMIAEVIWNDEGPMALMETGLRGVVARCAHVPEGQLGHHVRIDRLMVLLQQLPPFASTRDHGYLTNIALLWADKLRLQGDRRWWEVYPVFFQGEVEAQVREAENGLEIHQEGLWINGRLGAWLVLGESGLTTVAGREVRFQLSSLQQHPGMIKFVPGGIEDSLLVPTLSHIAHQDTSTNST